MRLCYSLVMFMALLALVSGVSLISGCGKKGPLYQPVEPQQQTEMKDAKTKAKQKTTTQTSQ